MAGEVSGRRQLKAMLRKNFLLKWRNGKQTFCEICTPVAFMFLLVLGWSVSLSDVEKTPATIYANDTSSFQELEGLLDRVIQPYDPPQFPLRKDCYPMADEKLQLCFGDRDWESVAKIMDHRGPVDVMTFDDFVGAHNLLRALIGDNQSRLSRIDKLTDSILHNLLFLGELTFAPNTPDVVSFIDLVNSTHLDFDQVYGGVYATEKEAVDAALKTDSDLNSTWGVIYFRELDLNAGKVDYTLRMNYSVLPSTKEYASLFDLGFDSTYQKYVYSGFLSLQNMVDRALLNLTDPEGAFQRTRAAEALGQTTLGRKLLAPQIVSNFGALQSTGSIGVRNSVTEAPGAADRAAWKASVQDYVNWKRLRDLDQQEEEPSLADRFLLEVEHPLSDLVGFWLRMTAPSLKLVLADAAAAAAPEQATLLGKAFPSVRAAVDTTYYAIPMPTPETNKNPFYQSSGPLVGLLMCMSMLYPVSRLLKSIVQEKETRTKETMKIMGLKQWAFVASWFTTYFLMFSLVAFLVALLLATTVLQRTDFMLLFFFFWLYVLSQITFAFMLQVFFDKAKLAGIVGPLLCFMCAVPRYAFFSGSADDYLQVKGLMSFTLSPTAFALGSDLLMQYEGANRGMSWGSLYDDDFSFGAIMFALLWDVMLYAALAWYFETVIPNEYGKQKKWYFLCQPSYWRAQQQQVSAGDNYFPADAVDEADEDDDGQSREPVQGDHVVRVHIKQLRKVYSSGRGATKKTTVAVNGLNLKLYEGQITALLGQNGAGKSTAISMLTGLMNPTSGDALFDGVSLVEQTDHVRRNLGVCPQHNVLFDQLTCMEHLRLFAILKGLPDDQVEAECVSMLEQVGLSDKANTYSAALSGGMQRKLSVGLALVGGSQIVFLDEPTSGMDPYSRRATWELLRQARHGRVIVLTTHFMDEADLLGDRIAIMSEGRLKCVGSSLFLKSRFGVGYNLTLTRAQSSVDSPVAPPPMDKDRIVQAVKKHVPDAKTLSSAGGEIQIQLPLSSVSEFSRMFAHLEKHSVSMGVGAYGIGMTTLEEVFMKFATLRLSGTEQELEGGMDVDNEGNPTARLVPLNSKGKQGVPLISGRLSFDEEKLDNINRPSSMSLNGPSGGLNHGDIDIFDDASARYAPASFMEQIKELFWKRWICAKRDVNGRLFEVVLPVLVVALVLAILKLNINPAGPSILLGPSMYSRTSSSASLVSGPADTPFNVDAWSALEPEAMQILTSFRQNKTLVFEPRDESDSYSLSEYLLDTYNGHARNRYGAYVLNDTLHLDFHDGNGPQEIASTLSVLHNTTFWHALPLLVNEVTQARMLANTEARRRVAAGSLIDVDATTAAAAAPEGYLNLRNHPLPLTKRENATIQTFLTLFAALFVLIPFCYLPASFVIFIVRERAVKAKHLQMVSGVHPVAYWLSTYLWDVVNYLFVAICCMLVFLMYGSQEFVGNGQVFMGTFYLILAYGLACIPLSYVYSFGFVNHSSAQVGIAAIHFVCGFVLIVASFILDNVASTKDANRVLKHFYRLSPPYNLGEGLMQLSTQDLLKEWGHAVNPTWSWEVIGRNLFVLHMEAVAYFLLALAIEYGYLGQVGRRINHFFNGDPAKKNQAAAADNKAVELRQPLLNLNNSESEEAKSAIALGSNAGLFDDAAEDEEDDVRIERMHIRRVMHGDPETRERFLDENVLVLDQLRKVYLSAKGGGKRRRAGVARDSRDTPEGFVAVRNLSVAVPRGQCIALLGVNGCGKTTTMKSITGDHKPSGGDAFVAKWSIRSSINEVRQNLGYTPQFDPLLDLMTGREHLRLYARLRGIPASRVDQVVDDLVETVALQKFADRVSSSYSGGNKRKLSLAIALIGSPQVILLDEPSTGMDPVSKRFMWNVIAKEVEQNQCAMVLTTHSMEEAEALCSRIAIMVAGRLTCLGSAQHLKSKYGKGYHLDINTTEAQVPDVREFVEKTFPGSVLVEFHAGKLLYQLPQLEEYTLSSIFGTVEQAKQQLGIMDYALSQTSLEQIFVLKAKQHARETEMDDE